MKKIDKISSEYTYLDIFGVVVLPKDASYRFTLDVDGTFVYHELSKSNTRENSNLRDAEPSVIAACEYWIKVHKGVINVN